MSKSAFIRARVEPDLKEEAEQILLDMGLSVTEALTIVYKHVVKQKKLPGVIIPLKKGLKTSKQKEEKIPAPKQRKIGGMKGKLWIADDFDDPLPEEIMRYFE